MSTSGKAVWGQVLGGPKLRVGERVLSPVRLPQGAERGLGGEGGGFPELVPGRSGTHAWLSVTLTKCRPL